MSHSLYSEPIVETPRYSASLYPGGAVGIELKPHTTDATPQRVKSSLPERDEHGRFNQWVVAGADTEAKATWHDWMKKLGKIIAKEVVKEDLKRQGDRWTGDVDRTVLAELPENYVLYVHKSQKAYDPRTDAYLVGSRHVKVFRSPAEFAHHLIWLMNGSLLKPTGEPDCDCIYCDSSQTQAEISYKLGMRRKEPLAPVARGDGAKKPRVRRKRSLSPASIPFKDYRQLNQQKSS